MSVLTELLSKIFGNRNQRVIRRLQRTVEIINSLESGLKMLTDQELAAKTAEFKQRVQQGETLDALLPEAFAVVREASVRTLGLRHFDVQMIGGMVLHQGKISEMRTGEGKTLGATLPAYLNALSGKPVHIITVNDYLARRDAAWMTPIYNFLGLSVGVVVAGMNFEDKKAAYLTDITYGTNNEYGFDYLRDNMAFDQNELVQRGLGFAIVDEVDSILIDEARTPLIISGSAEDSSELYVRINKLMPRLSVRPQEGEPGDFFLDEKGRVVMLTEAGHEHIEQLLLEEGLLGSNDSLYATSNIALMHHVMAALRAHQLFHRDVDYIVRDGQIVIVDEHTGRLMPGRRWSEGLHQAIEAKEGLSIQPENQTLATITFQNFFRLYERLSGMTGTADTEAYEFHQIYGLEVIVIPTNQPMVRKDYPDLVFLHAQGKFKAIIEEIKSIIEKGAPVLVGTASIETSEYLSGLLREAGIAHQVLNAKLHEQEAKIIAQAGRPGAVTIATNMAGRGTDIVLGGNLEAELSQLAAETTDAMIAQHKSEWQERHAKVIAAGGLHIIGTERHESRRIDNQLRGRSGRQGDPGCSRFYLSVEDNLIRIFAPPTMPALLQRIGMQEDVPLESSFLSRAIEGAQRKVESRNFDIRKQLLEYDDVVNEQRKVVYQQRNEILHSAEVTDLIINMRHQAVESLMDRFIPRESMIEQWNIQGLMDELKERFELVLPVAAWVEAEADFDEQVLFKRIMDALIEIYQQKQSQVEPSMMRHFERSVLLQILDTHWREHLSAMDHLRHGIHLRGYAAKNPKQEYKREAFELFAQMLERFRLETLGRLTTVVIQTQEDVDAVDVQRRQAQEIMNMKFTHADAENILKPDEIGGALSAAEDADPNMITTYTRQLPKVGRNDPCPCGSGKKFKRCHGAVDSHVVTDA